MTSVLHRESGKDYPLAAGGEGMYLHDAQGRQYLDMSGGAAVSCLGHGHPGVIAAIKAQADRLAFAHTSFFSNAPQEELAAVIAGRFADPGAKVYFICDGSEATETSLKLAWQYWQRLGKPQKRIVISRRFSYHGNTLGALSVSGNPARRAGSERVLLDWPRIAPCHAWRHQEPEETEAAYGLRAARTLEGAILATGAENVAAFIAEPVSGASLGAVPAVAGYFREIRAICDRYEVLLILDEVMTGAGRTGSYFAYEQEGIVPDIVTLAKGLSGGYLPLGATLARAAVHEVFAQQSFAHGHTYVGHAMSCAAALAVQQVLESEDLLARVAGAGERLRAALTAAFGEHPYVGDIRGRGLLQAIELVADRETKAPFADELRLPARLKEAAMEEGLIVYPGGGPASAGYGPHILLAPPYIVEDRHIAEGVDKLGRVLAACLPAQGGRAMNLLLRSLLAASVALASVRDPVLKQIQLPHNYYWREMYIPQLTSGPSSATWSPDGASVVYSMKGSLWRQALSADEAVELTHGPGYDYQPDWSPDGHSIIFVRHDRDAIHLVRLDLATGREQVLTQGDGVDLEPRFSPDGQRIVFVSSRQTGHFDLYLAGLGAEGLTGVRPLVAGRVSTLDRYYYSPSDHAINPSWSPDGKRIVYVGNPEIAWGTGDLWSVAVDDPEDKKHILTEETTWSARPELAHDGKRLLYASYQGRAWHQLWLTTPEGRSPLPLTFGDFDRTNARWSPDDARILYISNEAGNTALWQQTVLGGARSEIKAKTLRWKQPMAQLALSLTDDKGSPLPGRVSTLGADGRYYAPDDAWIHGDDSIDHSLQSQETRYFHCPARCTLTVPAGAVTLTATHGFAHASAIQTVQAGAITLTLPANGLPARFGPHLSADLHVHMNYGGHYRQRQEGLAAQAAAEDLDIVYNLIVNKEQRIPDLTEFSTTPRTIGGVTIFQGQEFHTSYWGHLGLLHLNDHLLTPDFAAYRHTAMASLVPTNGMIADLAHAQGALVGYVHPFDDPIVPEKEKSLSHALPVDVALGRTDYLEIVSFANPVATAEVWYRLLNLGYRLPAGAGTDAMTNYASLRGPVGLNRIFLRAASRDPETLKAAIKNGHGFVTNGPLLGLIVNGKAPGETITLPAAGTVTVDTALRSIVPIADWEIVFNGKVVKRLTPQPGGTSGEETVTLPITTSGWLLVRAVNPQPNPLVQDLFPYATTNPVWIEVAGKPQTSPEDAAYFVRWIDRVIESAGARDDYNTAAEKTAVLEDLRRARAVYMGMAR